MDNLIRYSLGVLVSIVAINAFAGGFYGLSGAEGVPVEWLEGTPFRDYTIPSVILIAVVGGSCVAAAIAVFSRSGYAQRLSVLCGAIMLFWIIVQTGMVGYVSWLQPAIAVAGTGVIALAWYLPKN